MLRDGDRLQTNHDRRTANKIHTGRGTALTLIRGPRGGKSLPGLAAGCVTNRSSQQTGEAAQLDFTKWPRRFFCQQASFLAVQNRFSLPELARPTPSADTPRETMYCLKTLARPSPTATPSS